MSYARYTTDGIYIFGDGDDKLNIEGEGHIRLSVDDCMVLMRAVPEWFFDLGGEKSELLDKRAFQIQELQHENGLLREQLACAIPGASQYGTDPK